MNKFADAREHIYGFDHGDYVRDLTTDKSMSSRSWTWTPWRTRPTPTPEIIAVRPGGHVQRGTTSENH